MGRCYYDIYFGDMVSLDFPRLQLHMPGRVNGKGYIITMYGGFSKLAIL